MSTSNPFPRSHLRTFAHAAVLLAAGCWPLATAAEHRTANFVAMAATPELAQQVAEAAEWYRFELAHEWLGEALPKWSAPCPIQVSAGPTLGAGGATSFQFRGGGVGSWEMRVQGSQERILDSVLPHEVTHTVFASHFRRPLPRWADEGGASTMEWPGEQARMQQLLIEHLMSGRGIAFNELFAMKDYPQDIQPLYCQGRSLATYLIDRGGRHKFVAFLDEGLSSQQWPVAVEAHYGYDTLGELQDAWLGWVRAGSPQAAAEGEAVAMHAHRPGCPCRLCQAAPTLDPEPPTAEEADARPPKPVPTPPVAPKPTPPAPVYVTPGQLAKSQAEQEVSFQKSVVSLQQQVDGLGKLMGEVSQSVHAVGENVNTLTETVAAKDQQLAAADAEQGQRFTEISERIKSFVTLETVHDVATATTKKGLEALGKDVAAPATATWLGLPITGLLVAALGISGPPAIAIFAGMWLFRRRVVKPVVRKVTADLDTRVRGGGDGGAAPESPFPLM